MVDFGDDALTAGRAHPMIDPTLRLEHLARAAADDETAVLLLDVVLGHGAEPDPAAALAPAIEPIAPAAWSSRCVGTAGDPQGLARQVEAAGRRRRRGAPLQRRGHPAGRRPAAGRRVDDPRPTASSPSAPTCSREAVAAQAVAVTRVDWRPPDAGHRGDLAAVAADPLRRDANARALAALLAVQALLVDVAPASEVLGLQPGEFLHAGPPISVGPARRARCAGP